MELAFYASALVAVYSTLRVISTSNPMHALLNLIISLIAVAMIFFCLGAAFAGALQVYPGLLLNWCRGRDSNPHTLEHYPLKIACLPIPPPRQNSYSGTSVSFFTGALLCSTCWVCCRFSHSLPCFTL